MKKLMYAAVLLLTLAACTRENEGKQKIKVLNLQLAPPPGDFSMAKAQANSNTNNAQNSSEIIKEGEISFETKSIDDTRKAIYNSLKKLGGYIAEENETNDTTDSRNEYLLKAKIPAINFELFLNSVSSNAAKVNSKNIRARDVSAEYIDINTHIANEKKLEQRYVQLLQKGTKIADLLEIENKINQIETTIDSTQAQLNYLTRLVDYSSLDITFYTKQAVKNNDQTFGVKLIAALSGGWADLGVFFFGCVAIWPLWIVAAIVLYFTRAWLKKYPLKKAVV